MTIENIVVVGRCIDEDDIFCNFQHGCVFRTLPCYIPNHMMYFWAIKFAFEQVGKKPS